jgi:hypothetical protein
MVVMAVAVVVVVVVVMVAGTDDGRPAPNDF